MTPYNLSFLRIGEWSYMDINYRQNHYAFWRDYFPTVASRYPGMSLSPPSYSSTKPRLLTVFHKEQNIEKLKSRTCKAPDSGCFTCTCP